MSSTTATVEFLLLIEPLEHVFADLCLPAGADSSRPVAAERTLGSSGGVRPTPLCTSLCTTCGQVGGRAWSPCGDAEDRYRTTPGNPVLTCTAALPRVWTAESRVISVRRAGACRALPARPIHLTAGPSSTASVHTDLHNVWTSRRPGALTAARCPSPVWTAGGRPGPGTPRGAPDRSPTPLVGTQRDGTASSRGSPRACEG